jgi:hypothetical protein
VGRFTFSFFSFWSDRLNVLDGSLVLLDVLINFLEFANSFATQTGGSVRAVRSIRLVRMFRSARGLRTLRLMKFFRFARLGRHVKDFYTKLLYELDSKAQKSDAAEPLVGFVEIAW